MAFDRQQLERQGIYETKSSLPALLSDLEQISGMAAEIAARQRARAKTGGYVIVAGLIGAVLGGFGGLTSLVMLSILAIAGGLAWAIYSSISGRKFVAHRARLAVAQQRIAMIQQDAGVQSPFSFRLALASNPTKISDERWAGRKNGKEQLFEEPWLSLEGHLLDGTVVTDEIKDLTRKRMFSNARGKSKTKTRTTYVVNVRFSYPKELYGDARPAEQALHGELKVGPSATLRTLRVTEKAIIMRALVASENEITRTAGMLSVGGYRILNLARRMAAGQRGNIK